MDGIVFVVVWVPKIALVAAPVLLILWSRTVQGTGKVLWIVAFVVAYYVAPIPAYVYARDRLPLGGPLNLDAFMTASNLEYACIAVAFWAIYLSFRRVTRNANQKGKTDGPSA
jgi:hypothetical protein